MMKTTTAAMQSFRAGNPSQPAGLRGGSAGLVLLYSEAYAQLAPAYPLVAAEQYVGRDPTCAIVVPERAVSRRHAVLQHQEGGWVLRDLGGPNGTIVDGEFIGAIELEHLHEVRVGDTVFKFVERGAEAYQAYRIDGAIVSHAGRHAPRLTELVGGMTMDKVGEQVEKVAAAELSVIIQGESGTGKEVVARELHRLSERSGLLHAVNCAAIPGNLIESELFGYKRGAFSGADRDKPGLVAAAHNGTLLLDEIGDMPLEAQAKLLRVIQTREVFPVGATHANRVDVRFLAATNRDLTRLVKDQRFRGDLLARLNEFSISLPPLRDRKEDIFMLARTLLARHSFGHKRLSFPFMLGLLHHDWPYNVRELEACLRRAATVSDSDVLTPQHLPENVAESMTRYGRRAPKDMLQSGRPPSDVPPHPGAQQAPEGSLAPARWSTEPPPPGHAVAPSDPPTARHRAAPPTEEQLRGLLAVHHGNIAAVGRELGKERMQIHRWMQRYGITAEEYRS
jgi:transcriptional regulator with GAF, ATPase, and Fis domain